MFRSNYCYTVEIKDCTRPLWTARSIESVLTVLGSEAKVDREPRMHITDDLSSEKFGLHLTQWRVELYGLPCFSDIREANLLYTMVAAGPIPPAAERTSGVNEPCSISLMRSS